MNMSLRFAIPTLAALAVLTASPVVHAADMPLPAPAPAVTDNCICAATSALA